MSRLGLGEEATLQARSEGFNLERKAETWEMWLLVRGGGLAWLLWQGGVVVDVVDHRGSIGLGVYRREEGEEIVNIKQI